jgi:peptidoglycan-N-acetylglucosamine deacetylase
MRGLNGGVIVAWGVRWFTALILVLVFCTGAAAQQCANPNALGVSRVLPIDPRARPLVGSFDYGITLPLAPREVVLTFDDGPRPPYTNRVLKALADECVRATFFVLGRQALAFPAMVRELYGAGHTIGTHTQNHPMHRMSRSRATVEIEAGVVSIASALGSRQAVAPFFRFPGLYRTSAVETYLRSRGVMVWSMDVDSDDYRSISGKTMVQRIVSNLEKSRGGILLMHDIQPKTAAMLPTLLRNLKQRGFRIVHAVPRKDEPPRDLDQVARGEMPAEGFEIVFTSGVLRR